MVNSVLISDMFKNSLTIKMYKIVFVIILFGYFPVISAVKQYYPLPTLNLFMLYTNGWLWSWLCSII